MRLDSVPQGVIAMVLLFGSLLSAGCTEDSDDTGNAYPISIADAFVIDSDGFTSRGTSVSDIRPNNTSAEQFSLHWTVQGGRTPTHRADWFVSTDEVLQPDPVRPGVDVRILGRNCGIGFSDVCLENEGDAPCDYRTDMSVFCGDLGAQADNQPTSLASYFASTRGLPGRYFLLLRIQDPSNGDTVVRSFPVNFY